MSLINLTINNNPVSVPKGSTILEAAKQVNIDIPNLCHLKMDEVSIVNQCASCRVCMVSAGRGLVPACGTLVREGMNINTNTRDAIKARKTVVELLLSDHPQDCLVCDKNGDCELQSIAADLGVREIRFKGDQSSAPKDLSSTSIVKDHSKCILCRRCETMCNDIQTVGVLSGVSRGFDTQVGTFFGANMCDTECTFCGQCIAVCPTAALTEASNIKDVWNMLDQDKKPVAVQVAPAVRVAIGEEFGLEAGTISTGKLVAALKALGFDYIFDTNFAADLTIMEEASEFLHRLKDNKNLPILTSCCPGWINFVEHNFPDQLHLPSSCKSPQEMFGSIAKNYFAPKVLDKDPSDLYVVSVMPCIAKKYEASRFELSHDGVLDVDTSITTRELAKMIKEAGIDLLNLKEENFDNPLGESTGAADIFGATGGVSEAALRTAFEWATDKTLEDVTFSHVRGFDGIKEASIDIDGTTVNLCVVSTLGNARKIMDEVKLGKSKYHIIEVMACPGGCVAGGGQPYHNGDYDVIKKRAAGLYSIDGAKKLRKSHTNPSIVALYDNFLGEPHGEKAYKLLHTHYFDKSNVYGESESLEVAESSAE